MAMGLGALRDLATATAATACGSGSIDNILRTGTGGARTHAARAAAPRLAHS